MTLVPGCRYSLFSNAPYICLGRYFFGECISSSLHCKLQTQIQFLRIVSPLKFNRLRFFWDATFHTCPREWISPLRFSLLVVGAGACLTYIYICIYGVYIKICRQSVEQCDKSSAMPSVSNSGWECFPGSRLV